MATNTRTPSDEERIAQVPVTVEMSPAVEEYIAQIAIYHGLTVYRTSLLHHPGRYRDVAYTDFLVSVVDKQIEKANTILHRIAHQHDPSDWDDRVSVHYGDDPADVVHLTCTIPTH